MKEHLNDLLMIAFAVAMFIFALGILPLIIMAAKGGAP